MIPFDSSYYAQLKTSVNRFSPVSDLVMELLVAGSKLRAVGKDEYLLMKGERAKKIYFVFEGVLISQWTDEVGNVHIKNFFMPDNFAGSTVSLLLDEPSGFAIKSIKEGIVLQIPYSHYRKLINECQEFKDFYIAYLEKKWVIENERRQISFAAQSATDRYKTFLHEYPEIPQIVSQRLIASYLGITPTQLSRIRKSI